MISFLISALILAVVIYVIYLVINLLPLPEPIKTIVYLIFGLIALVYVLGLFGLAPIPLPLR